MKKTIKKNDEVVVISGGQKNQRGKVLVVDRERDRVFVEGVNMIKRHTRKTQENPQGGIIEREGSLHISNVMEAKRFEAKRAKKKK
jgi:large subunit ribosomal protein L24